MRAVESMTSRAQKTIVIIGTLDTKATESSFLRDTIARLGQETIVVDSGTMGEPGIAPDVTREEVAEAGGARFEVLVASSDKELVQTVMMLGLSRVVTRLHREGKCDGVVAAGGAQGTALATAAMRALPIGVPKVMVSTVACGQTTFGPYVGTSDVVMLHSVADISGLNSITSRLLAQAANAVVAMASVPAAASGGRPLLAITQAGITTPGVVAVRDKLEALGFELVAFHCNGVGGQAMEAMILDGTISGLIDFSPHEVTDLLFGGMMPAATGRLGAAGIAGIPHVVAPGATDVILSGARLPKRLRARAHVNHTPTHTHIRTNAREMAAVARYVAHSLNAGKGPRAAMVPLRGFSMLNREGGTLFDRRANASYTATLRRELAPEVHFIAVDAHINDLAFAAATVDEFMRLWAEAGRERPRTS